MKRLIARYETREHEPNWDRPDSVRFADDSPATMDDFGRRVLGSIGAPEQIMEHGEEVAVEVGMSINEEEKKDGTDNN